MCDQFWEELKTTASMKLFNSENPTEKSDFGT